jgi:flagellar basal body rod protein FlgC
MNIDTSASNLIQKPLALAQAPASAMPNDPVEGSVGLMQAKNALTAGVKVIKAKDEMLGTILDIKA